MVCYHPYLLFLLVDLILAMQPSVELGVRDTKWLYDIHRREEREVPEEVSPSHPRHRRSEGGDIVFPAGHPSSLDNRLSIVPSIPRTPACARGDTFCETVDEYPQENVIKLLKREPVFFKRFFHDDKTSYSSIENVEDRIDDSDDSPLCISQEQIVYPKMAKNAGGDWLFVINQNEYKQGIRVEKCVRADKECLLPASLPNGYRSQCKQKYIYRKLVALNGTGQGVITDSFPLPSCCSCVIHMDRSTVYNRLADSKVPLPLTLPKTTRKPRP